MMRPPIVAYLESIVLLTLFIDQLSFGTGTSTRVSRCPTASHPNTGYRNGAFTVQAIATGRRMIPGGGDTMGASSIEAGVVIWENANYEHFGDGCSSFNEALRAEKASSPGTEENPSDGSGTGSSGGSSAEVEGGSGSTLTQRIDVARSVPPDGRVSWLEVLE